VAFGAFKALVGDVEFVAELNYGRPAVLLTQAKNRKQKDTQMRKPHGNYNR
jgi:hypothetical protein